VAGLALAGLAIAWRPPATFMEIATEAFTDLAVLFPTVMAAVHRPRATPAGAIASIIVGEGLVVAYHFRLLPSFGTLPVVPIVAAASLTLVAVSLLTPPKKRLPEGRKKRARWGWALAFALLFAAGNGFWAWGDGQPGPLGFP